MNRINGGGENVQLADGRNKWPVGIWSKNLITVLWLLWVFGLCSVICMDIFVPYLLLKYNPEDLIHGFVVLGAVNCYFAAVMADQAQDIMEASETVDDVPWWCYGCTSSTRPKKRPVGIWSKNSITVLWLLWVFGLCSVICMDIVVPYLLLKYNPEDLIYGFVVLGAANCYCFVVMDDQAQDIIEASETVDDVPWWCYGCTSSTRPKKRPVALWNKNRIIGVWLLLVILSCLVICMDITVFYFLFKYHTEEIYYVSSVTWASNVFTGAILAEKARLLMEASETVNGVPWWCYGCTSSTRPKRR